MEIPIDVEVHCSDGLYGQATCLLVDPTRKEVTHLIVKETEPPHTERMVPIEVVSETTPDLILLHCTKGELDLMDPFIQTEYIREEMPDLEFSPAGYVGVRAPLIWRDLVPDWTQVIAVQHKQIPVGERAIRRGTRVEATDGHAGYVDELLVDPENERMTHLVVRQERLWGQQDVVIPVTEINRIKGDTVYLKLSKDEVGALATTAVR